jgi:hypothetical protein
LKLAWDKSATVCNFTSGFRKCGIYPYNPDVLADDVFEHEIVPAPNGIHPVRLEDIEDSPAPSSTAASFEELSPVPVITSRGDCSVRKGRKKYELAVVTSPAFAEKQRERADGKVDSETGLLE